MKFKVIVLIIIFSLVVVLFSGCVSEFEELDIDGKVIKVTSTDRRGTMLTFDNGQSIYINEGLIKVYINKSGIFHFRESSFEETYSLEYVNYYD